LEKCCQKFFVADFIHPDKLLAFIREAYFDVSAVVHMGAISSTTLRDVDRLISDKIRLTPDIWDLCTEFQIPFFYASSAATYGALEAGLLDDQRPTIAIYCSVLLTGCLRFPSCVA
jgi:ADP-L-glycero-D-manno-heptose 6-epimerase